MSPKELIDLIETLRAAGITHFKQGDLELDFAAPAQAPRSIAHYEPVSLEKPPAIIEDQAPHIVQQMKSLFKLSDEELVENIFPLPKEEAN